MATIVKLTCKNCNKDFEVNKGKEKDTCSNECRWELRKKEDEKYYINKKCEQCGKIFKSKRKENKKFCSYQCSANAKKEKATENRVCVECGDVFQERKKYKRDLCSQKCRDIWQNRTENKENRINKSKEILMEKYGVDSIFKLKNTQKEIQVKIKKTYSINKKNIINKIKETKNIKYCDENYNNIKQIKETKNIKYCDENYNNRKKFNETLNNKLKNRLNNINYEIIDIMDDNILKVKHPDGHIFESPRPLLILRLNENRELSTIKLPHSPNISNYELEIAEIMSKHCDDFITSDKITIKPYELDFYLPNNKLAIEFDGLYWHSELFKDSKYHIKKTKLCNDLGIQLIHIFEDEWVHKKDIVVSMILNKLNLNQTKIYGRKCIIKEINNTNYSDFLEKNHIMGKTKSSIRVGLFYNEELVSVIGLQQQKDNCLNLNRFCSKINHNVLGGASKLIKFIENKYQPKEIITFADLRYSNGGLYKTLGFDVDKKINPNYWYSDYRNVLRIHRFNFRKKYLSEFDKNKSEHEIMLERKMPRIYDCGMIRYKKTIQY